MTQEPNKSTDLDTLPSTSLSEGHHGAVRHLLFDMRATHSCKGDTLVTVQRFSPRAVLQQQPAMTFYGTVGLSAEDIKQGCAGLPLGFWSCCLWTVAQTAVMHAQTAACTIALQSGPAYACKVRHSAGGPRDMKPDAKTDLGRKTVRL